MTNPLTILDLHITREGHIALESDIWIVAIAGLCLSLLLLYRLWRSGLPLEEMEIDEAELGIGDAKLKFKPNRADRQVAYAIWVELSTRKIGLPIDFENDVVAEIYDSWFNFFSVTRELIKTVPISRVRDPGTKAIIRLSIEILNEGLRPHLTRWQARFRRWYERTEGNAKDKDPQEVQKEYPHWEELTADMRDVNDRLIKYRQKMLQVVYGGGPVSRKDPLATAAPSQPDNAAEPSAPK